MWRRLSSCWLIPLAVVVLLLAACDDSTDVAADTPVAPTTTASPTTTTVATTTTTIAMITAPIADGPFGLAPVIAAARADGVAFDFADHELCAWFTTDEILEIVALAYAFERVDYPLPTTLAAEPSEKDRDDRAGCDWTVPGTPGGWGRPDFTVMFRDESNVRLYTDTGRNGPTILEVQKQEIAEGLYDDSWPGGVDADIGDALLAGGVLPMSGWSPGFYFHVESQDRSIDFRHDLAAGPEGLGTNPNGREDYAVEAFIVNAMLERMHWLPTATD